MTQNKKATYGEAMEQKALVSNTILQPREIDIVRMLHVFQSNKNSYNSYTTANRSHKHLNQKLIEFFKGNLFNKLGYGKAIYHYPRTLPIDQRTGYNAEWCSASNIASTSGLILNDSLDTWRNHKKVSFNNKKYLFLQAFLDKYGKPAFYKIATPLSHGDSYSTSQSTNYDRQFYAMGNSVGKLGILRNKDGVCHNNNLGRNVPSKLLDGMYHIPKRHLLNGIWDTSWQTSLSNKITFNNFFPYKQSFLCYWLIPFIGIVACLPTTSHSGLWRSHNADSLAAINNWPTTSNTSTFSIYQSKSYYTVDQDTESTIHQISGRIEDQNLNKNFDLRLQLYENSLKKLGSIYVNKLFQLLQTNPKEIISISSNNSLNKEKYGVSPGCTQLHKTPSTAELKEGKKHSLWYTPSYTTYFNALVSENVLTQNILQKSSFHWYWHNPFYTFYKKPYNQNEKLSHFSRKLLSTFGKSCLMPYSTLAAQLKGDSVHTSGIDHVRSMPWYTPSSIIANGTLCYDEVYQMGDSVQEAISNNPVTSYKLALFLMDNMMANKCILSPKNTLTECIKYSLECMPENLPSLNSIIGTLRTKPRNSVLMEWETPYTKPVKKKEWYAIQETPYIKRACLNVQDSTWILSNIINLWQSHAYGTLRPTETNIIPTGSTKRDTNSGHLWGMETFYTLKGIKGHSHYPAVQHGKAMLPLHKMENCVQDYAMGDSVQEVNHKTFLDSNKCFGITEPNSLVHSVISGLPYKTLHPKSYFYFNLLDSCLKKSDWYTSSKPYDTLRGTESARLVYNGSAIVNTVLKINHPILTSDSFFTKKQKAKENAVLLSDRVYQFKSKKNDEVYHATQLLNTSNKLVDGTLLKLPSNFYGVSYGTLRGRLHTDGVSQVGTSTKVLNNGILRAYAVDQGISTRGIQEFINEKIDYSYSLGFKGKTLTKEARIQTLVNPKTLTRPMQKSPFMVGTESPRLHNYVPSAAMEFTVYNGSAIVKLKEYNVDGTLRSGAITPIKNTESLNTWQSKISYLLKYVNYLTLKSGNFLAKNAKYSAFPWELENVLPKSNIKKWDTFKIASNFNCMAMPWSSNSIYGVSQPWHKPFILVNSSLQKSPVFSSSFMEKYVKPNNILSKNEKLFKKEMWDTFATRCNIPSYKMFANSTMAEPLYTKSPSNYYGVNHLKVKTLPIIGKKISGAKMILKQIKTSYDQYKRKALINTKISKVSSWETRRLRMLANGTLGDSVHNPKSTQFTGHAYAVDQGTECTILNASKNSFFDKNYSKSSNFWLKHKKFRTKINKDFALNNSFLAFQEWFWEDLMASPKIARLGDLKHKGAYTKQRTKEGIWDTSYGKENISYDLTENYTMLSKKIANQKRRRARKERMETKRQKIRKRFHPRPIWLRFRTGIHFRIKPLFKSYLLKSPLNTWDTFKIASNTVLRSMPSGKLRIPFWYTKCQRDYGKRYALTAVQHGKAMLPLHKTKYYAIQEVSDVVYHKGIRYTPSIKCYNLNKPLSLNNPYFYEKSKKSRLNKMTKDLNKTQLNSYFKRVALEPYLNKLEKQQKKSILFDIFNHAYNALIEGLRYKVNNNLKSVSVKYSKNKFNTKVLNNGALKGIDNLKYSLDSSFKFNPWLRYKRAKNLSNYNEILDYRIKNLSLNMKKVLDRSTIKNNANYIDFTTEPLSAYDQYMLKLKDKKRGPKHIWAWFYNNISKIDGYTSLNMNKTLWHFFPGDKAPPWYKIRPYNEIINNNSKQRIDWALKKTNIWGLNKVTKRDRLWQLTKFRRQAKLNNIKFRARKRFLKQDAFFSGDLKLQNKLNKIGLPTDISSKWHAVYQNNGLMRKRANKGYNVNIFQKIRQKEEKLNLLISSKSIKALSKKNLKKSLFFRKTKYFWWSNNWPNSFRDSVRDSVKDAGGTQFPIKNYSKNVSQGFKVLPFYGVSHNVISGNGADMPQTLGNSIINKNLLLNISILLIHFCVLISFISISQIRYLIKAHFIFLSKLSKRYIDIVHSVLSLFNQLNSELNLIANDFKSLMSPNLNKSMFQEGRLHNSVLSNKTNISMAKWDTPWDMAKPLSSKHLAFVKPQDVKYSKFTLNLIKREFKLTKNGTLAAQLKGDSVGKPKWYTFKIASNFNSFGILHTPSSLLPFWGKKSIKTESLVFSKKPINYSNISLSVWGAPYTTLKQLWYTTSRKTLTEFGVKLEFLVTMSIFFIKGVLNSKTGIATTSNFIRLILKSFSVNLFSKKFNTIETVKKLFYRSKLGFYLFSLCILNYLEKYIVMFALCLESGFNPIVEYFKYAEENALSLLSDIFLLEWTADLTDLIPEKICLDLWTSFSRFSRGTKSIFLGLGLGPIAFINAFTLNVFERRLLCLFDTVIEILGQPDTELMIREKKGSIVWDVWAEFLMKISDNYNINVEALSMGVLDEPGVFQEEFPLLQEEQKRAVDLLCNDNGEAINDISILGLKENAITQSNYPGLHKRNLKQDNMWLARKWQSRFSNTVWYTSLNPFLSFRTAWDMASPYKNGIQIAKESGIWYTPYLWDKKNKPTKTDYINSIEKQGTNSSALSTKVLNGTLNHTVAMNMNFLEFLTFSKPDGWTGSGLHNGLVLNNANWTNWSVSQFLTYQGEDTDLIIDLNPPKSFTHISSIKHLKELYQPLGTLVCQIYSGILSKQTAKNVLVIGGSGNDKTLLIQALAGETELKIITDNANRYGLIDQGVAVGIKLLREVFDAVALHAPCLFLLEDIHVIGQRRPLLESDDEKAKGTEINFGGQREEVNEKNLVIYKLNKNAITHYQKPYKGDYSFLIPTNNFSFDLFLKSSPSRIRGISSTFRFPMENVYKTNSGEHDGLMEVDNNETMQSNLENGLIRQSNKKSLKQKNAILPSFLQVPPDQLFAPPATSPFTILVLKEQKKLKVKTVVKELPLAGLPGEQLSLVPKISYSIRVKVFVLADLALSNLSAKLDMITDLLLILDSVRSNRGFVVFATTHSPFLLDPALRRPGRLDETICLASVGNINSRWEIVKSIKSSLQINNKRHMLAGLFPGHVPNRTFDLIDYVNLTSLDLTNGSALVNQQFQYTSFLLINKKWETTSSNSGQRQGGTPLAVYPNTKATALQRYGVYGTSTKVLNNGIRSLPLGILRTTGMQSTNIPSGKLLSHQGTQFNIKSNGMPSAYTRLRIEIKTNNHCMAKPWSVKMKTTKTIKATTYFQIGKKLINIKLGYNLNSYSPIFNNNITNNANLASTDSADLSKELQYVTFYSKQNILKQNLLRLFSGKVSEAFAFSNTNLKTEGFNNLNLTESPKKTYNHYGVSDYGKAIYQSMTHLSTFDTNVKMPSALRSISSAGLNGSSGQLNSLYTTYGIDQTWRSGTSLIYSLIQKRYLYNKNMIVPKLIQFSNGSSPQEPPSPPYSNLLIPAKRFENYKRTLRHSIERKTAFSIQDKIQFHQQQRVIRRLYRLPVKESFRSEIMQSAIGTLRYKVNQNRKNYYDEVSHTLRTYTVDQGTELCNLGDSVPTITESGISNNASSISFTNASMVLGPLEKSVHKPSSVNWYYRNRILMRHRYYLNNQWWNGQLDEHNLETIFLSDIDWRYTFVESLGDILIDFPDSDQHYHPRQRRWMLNSGYWNSWFNFDKIVNQEIYSHFVLETFTKAYNLLDKNREILDYVAAKFIKSGMVKELHFVAGLKRFKIS